MENKVREIITSEIFDNVDIPSIFYYGMDTFGIKLADSFIEEIYFRIENGEKCQIIQNRLLDFSKSLFSD